MQNNSGLRYSALLHGTILLFMIFGLPEFLTPPHPPEPTASTDRIIAVTMAPSNIPTETKSVEKPKPKEPIEPPKAIKKTVESAPEKAPPPPPPPKPKPAPPKIAKPTPPKETKKEEKKVQKEESLADVLKSVEKTANAEQDPHPKKTSSASEHTSKSDRPYTPGLPLSLNELDGIKQQFEKCWVPPAGADARKNLIVTVHAVYGEDGALIHAELPSTGGRYLTDPAFRAASDTALRTVRKCTPLKNLPGDKFETWRIQDLNFNPSDYQ